MQGTGHDLLHHPLSASRFSGEKAAVRSRGFSPASSLCEPGFVPPSSTVPSSPRYRAAWSVYHAWESGCFNTASEVVPRSIAPALAGGSRSLRLRSVAGKPGHVLRTKVFYAPGKRFAGRHPKVYLKSRKFSLFLQAQLAFALNRLEIHKGFLRLFALNPACACEIFVIFFVFRYTLTFRTCCGVKKGKR